MDEHKIVLNKSKKIGSDFEFLASQVCIAKLYEKMGEYDKALKSCQNLIKISKRYPSYRYIPSIRMLLAGLKIKMGDIRAGKRLAKDTLTSIKKLDFHENLVAPLLDYAGILDTIGDSFESLKLLNDNWKALVSSGMQYRNKAYLLRGKLRLKSNDPIGAEKDIRIVLKFCHSQNIYNNMSDEAELLIKQAQESNKE